MREYKGETEILRELCLIPGPSGAEERVREKIKEILSEMSVTDTKEDRAGNLTVLLRSRVPQAKRVMVSAHMDEVGMIVNEITDKGYLKFECIGGIDPRVLCGRRVVITDERGDVNGIIASKAIHHQKKEERKTATPVDKMYMDIGAGSKEEAEKLVSLGAYCTFDANFRLFGSGDGYICSKAVDDRLGCAVMIELIRLLKESDEKLPYDLYFCFTVREETGLTGALSAANAVKPDICIVLESTAVADIPGVDETKRVAKLGDGGAVSLADRSTLYDRKLVELALKIAEEKNIKAQIKKYLSGGNDAGFIHMSGKGVRTLAVSAPTRYLHSASCVASVEDFHSVIKLMHAVLTCGELI